MFLVSQEVTTTINIKREVIAQECQEENESMSGLMERSTRNSKGDTIPS